jgi:monofunctional biosynthetic peptidoglycan transglycosylase
MAAKGRPRWLSELGRLAALVALCALALQLYFLARVVLMVWVDPGSTSFQRSEAWRLLVETHHLDWAQDSVEDSQLSKHLKRAVIASEDAGFVDHHGVEWDAIEKAWERNQKAAARVERLNQQRAAPAGKTTATPVVRAPKIVGGSTISQQLAKNLFLSGERTGLRKAQEFVLTAMLEGVLGKQRILTLYLNNVEWGEGVFGAQAASRHYFRVNADQLSPAMAARLAVMLPAPKRFEKTPGSPYVASRSATIVARMAAVELPTH